MLRLFTGLLALLCSGCIQLGEPATPNHYYLLEPLQEETTETVCPPLTVKIEPIRFPGYLDRLQIVTHLSNNRIEIKELDRWGEPLPDNFVRALRENLQNQLPGLQTNDSQPLSRHYSLQLVVNSFDGIPGETLDVDIRWTLYSAEEDGERVSAHFRDQRPIGNTVQQLVEKLGAALGDLSKQISTEIAALSN